jgi:predicted transcriptional regulator
VYGVRNGGTWIWVSHRRKRMASVDQVRWCRKRWHERSGGGWRSCTMCWVMTQTYCISAGNTCKCSIILATAGMTHQPTAPLSLNTISQILMFDILSYKCNNTAAIPYLLAELNLLFLLSNSIINVVTTHDPLISQKGIMAIIYPTTKKGFGHIN